MPYSYPKFKNEFKKHLHKILPSGSRILDVGPGAGTYSDLLLNSPYTMDCVEIWEPYIHTFNLTSKYENVYIEDILSFDIADYDYIIFGDVLEHIDVLDAQNLINKINSLGKKCMVAVPYLYPQGESEGNSYEEHKQPDLTYDVIRERYPSLNLLFGDDTYGYYTNYKSLTTIANSHKTDKGTVYYEAHGYTEVYSDSISSECSDCSLLEIGVWRGDSVRMWNEYNPNMKIFAIDIDPNVKNFLNNGESLDLFIGNQSDINLLDTVFRYAKTLDYVIDDGSHAYHDIVNSFNYIFPRLKHGAIYFIEDLHAIHENKHLLIGHISKMLKDSGIPRENMEFFFDDKLLKITKSR